METTEEEKIEVEKSELEDGEVLPARQEGFAILRTLGVPQVKAARMVGYGKGMSSYLEKKLQKKYDLTSRKFVKLAAAAVESLLKGRAFGQIEKVKDSTVIAAAQMVYDRAQPKQEASMDKEEYNFIQINVDALKGIPSPEEAKKLVDSKKDGREEKGDNLPNESEKDPINDEI